MFESESLYHVLVEYPHPSMVLCRERLKYDVVELSRLEATLQTPQPPVFDQSEMWGGMILCTSSVSFPVQLQMAAPLHRPWTQHAVSLAEKVVAEGIRAGVTVHDRDGIF